MLAAICASLSNLLLRRRRQYYRGQISTCRAAEAHLAQSNLPKVGEQNKMNGNHIGSSRMFLYASLPTRDASVEYPLGSLDR